jgi:hypothetical protein
MSRFSYYDTDEERLPEGMTRVGYDADTQVYTYKDEHGDYWEGAPGSRYGRMTRVGAAPEPLDDFELQAHLAESKKSWRHELMPLLNFFLLCGLFLVAVFWYLGYTSHSQPAISCADGSSPYKIQIGDTCWKISEEHHLSVEKLKQGNPGIDCDKLPIGGIVCVPEQ